jgi:hypothetical protein
MFGALFGLPADISLAIALSKRVRELLLGLPGLLVWQWTETRGFLHRKGASPEAEENRGARISRRVPNQ